MRLKFMNKLKISKILFALIPLFTGIINIEAMRKKNCETTILNKSTKKYKASESDYSAKEQNKVPKVNLKKIAAQIRRYDKKRKELTQAIINFDPTSETECSQELESMAFNVLGYPSDNKTLNENSYAILFNVYRSLNQELEKLDESAETESHLELENKIEKIANVLIGYLTKCLEALDALRKEREEQARKWEQEEEEFDRLAEEELAVLEQDILNEQKLKALREKQRLEEEKEQRKQLLYEKYLKGNKPTYHERLFNDFLDLNKTFNNDEIINDTVIISNKNKSIFYHTYAPILDIFIKKHPHNKGAPHQIRDGRLLRIYKCPGFITWRHMRNKPTMFEIAFVSDIANKCYHRGYDLLKKNIPLTPEQRAKLTDEASYEEITLDALNEGLVDKRIYHNISFKENDYFIKVQDTRNNATLILIKPLKNSN